MARSYVTSSNTTLAARATGTGVPPESDESRSWSDEALRRGSEGALQLKTNNSPELSQLGRELELRPAASDAAAGSTS